MCDVISFIYHSQITREAYGMIKTIELIPNGTHINVTQENKLVNSFWHEYFVNVEHLLCVLSRHSREL